MRDAVVPGPAWDAFVEATERERKAMGALRSASLVYAKAVGATNAARLAYRDAHPDEAVRREG